MIDFHCHLDLYPDPVSVADKCVAQNLYVLSVTTAPSAWPKSRELLEREGRIRVALGLHPQIAHERHSEIDLFRSLVPRAKYVGEIGLDGAPEYVEHWEIQTDVFNQALKITSDAGGRVMSLHCRLASAPVLDAISKYRDAGIPVLHWFSGTPEELAGAIALDCWFSVGPTMLNSERGRELAARMPHDRVLTETDGPFAKLKGQSVFPWDAERAVGALARVWKIPNADARSQLLENFHHLTSLASYAAD